ncbi:MAG: hypothetical protein JXJ04_14370 [Spirochaetales bacterium]|nr:hypothetical protein [Spirochaetales bacterium]
MNKKHTITVYLAHPDVPYWNFSQKNFIRLQHALPDCHITICSSSEEFCNELPLTTIALVWFFKEEWLSCASNLEWVVTPAAGRDYFYIPESSHIKVDYCSFHGELMGETVMAMMLSHVRGMSVARNLMGEHAWSRKRIWPHMRTLRGATVVILGFGHIGSWIGKLIKPFGVHIIGVKVSRMDPPDYFDENDSIITTAELDSVLPRADHLVLALPGNKDTTDIINKKRIDMLHEHAVIYNVGRGNAICESALIESLKNNRIEAAYLDVVKDEPLSLDSSLWDCPRLFIMPHASAIAPNYLDLFIEEFLGKYNAAYGSILE